MNRTVLLARIAEAQPLRHTPAGIPVLDLRLEHESRQPQAGGEREVKLAIRAVAFGTQAESLARQALGSAWRFDGFLAATRGGKHPVLHIQQFQPES